MIVINGNLWIKMYLIVIYVLFNVMVKWYVWNSVGLFDCFYLIKGDVVNKNMDDYVRIIELIKIFVVS